MYFKLISVLVVLLHATASTEGDIGELLDHFEILHRTDVHQKVSRRNVGGHQVTNKEVTLETFGRKFHLNLHVNKAIFAPDVKAFAVDETGEETEIDVNKDVNYEGVVEGDDDSQVLAQLDDDVLTAKIITKEDVYYIEPSWRHINNSSFTDMISYRHSDIKFNFTSGNHTHPGHVSFCGAKGVYSGDPHEDNIGDSASHSRRRRSVSQNTCSLAVVADYRFYKEMGQSNYAKTINYMAGVVDRVNQIYRETEWSSGYKDIGFEIKKISVHTSDGGKLYNEEKKWQIKSLLEAFSREDWTKVCLAHLFTYQDFDNGVIGLAYVGNPQISAVGGICSRVYVRGSETLYLNSGLSSGINWGRKLLTEESDIVTAHELGHNFGAEHDPDTAECAPSDQKGGKYIMYPASVAGNKKNNQKFSRCSRSSVYKTLRGKSSICFTEPKGEFCGNFKVEGDEQCDPGNQGNSECCKNNCKLKNGKECSDLNDPCCENCMYAPSTKICRGAQPLQCKAETKCSGRAKGCPDAGNAPDDTPCAGLGICHNGNCLSFCKQHSMEPCACSELAKSCKLCCKNTTTACRPYTFSNGTDIKLDNGELCPEGACVHGTCTKVSQDPIERFWSLITDVNINALAEFMKDNIVGTIVIFSLLFWIPLSCIVHKIDLKRDKKEDELSSWYDPRNNEFIRRSKRAIGNIFKPQDQSGRKKSDITVRYEGAHAPSRPKPARPPPPKVAPTV